MKGGTPADLLLEWYEKSARDLPWRVGPRKTAAGMRQDPYIVWLSEVMLQQTTVVTVGPYFRRFLERWPTVKDLAAAPLEDVLELWAGLGYYARARNLAKCAKAVVERHDGAFPRSEAALRELPGVGAYTAAAIAAIAFDAPAVVVDGNVERVVSRYRRIETPLPDAKPEIKAATAALTPERRTGDFAQAMMDLGATICTPKRPACALCPWMGDCEARLAGVAERLPAKKAKPKKPTRRGTAYLLLDAQGRVLLQRRPETGLLGGMLGLPTTDWRDAEEAGPETGARPGTPADWRALDVEVRHTFTHFHLVLALEAARLATKQKFPLAAEETWADIAALDNLALPTVMRKALRLGLSALDAD